MTVEITQHMQNTTCHAAHQNRNVTACSTAAAGAGDGGGRMDLQKAHETVRGKFRGVDLPRVTLGGEADVGIAKRNLVWCTLTLRLGVFPAAWNEQMRTEIRRAVIQKWA
jgi:hypothetical protein